GGGRGRGGGCGGGGRGGGGGRPRRRPRPPPGRGGGPRTSPRRGRVSAAPPAAASRGPAPLHRVGGGSGVAATWLGPPTASPAPPAGDRGRSRPPGRPRPGSRHPLGHRATPASSCQLDQAKPNE